MPLFNAGEMEADTTTSNSAWLVLREAQTVQFGGNNFGIYKQRRFRTPFTPCFLRGEYISHIMRASKKKNESHSRKNTYPSNQQIEANETSNHHTFTPFQLETIVNVTKSPKTLPTCTQTPDRQHEGSARGTAASRAQRRTK